MRKSALAIAVLGFLAPVTPLAGQEERSLCAGRGAAAPDWFERPPAPFPGTYQAEARSGGCPDAETAQKVAARTAAWRLAHLLSGPVLIEDLQRRWQKIGTGTRGREEQHVELVQRALAGRILADGWTVYRQLTRWTPEGLAEHFMIVRVDSAKIRELTEEELRTYVSQLREPGGGLIDLEAISDSALEWVEVPRDSPQRRSPVVVRAVGPGSVSIWDRPTAAAPGPREQPSPVPRLVLAGALRFVESAGTTELRLERASASLDLLPVGVAAALVLAGTYDRDDGRVFGLLELPGTMGIGASETMAGFLLVAFHGWPPLYGGVRQGRREVARADLRLRVNQTDPAFFVGLGVPLFTQWDRGPVQNAYVEMALGGGEPAVRHLGAGLRGELASAPGVALRALLTGEAAFTPLGPAGALVPEFVRRWDPPETQLLVRALGAEGGLEITIAGVVSVLGTARFVAHRLLMGSGSDLAEYDRVADDLHEIGFATGVRLAF